MLGTAIEDSQPHPTEQGVHAATLLLDPRPRRERRYKIISIDPEILISAFNMFSKTEYLALPQTESLPEGSRVLNVTYNFDRQCLDAIIGHPSFPIVPDGEFIPRIESCFLPVTVMKKKELPFEPA